MVTAHPHGQSLADADLDRPGADPSFDRFARLVTRHLGVSTALVTFVMADAQLYPGALGLPEPLQTTRRSAFPDPMCAEVVRAAGPLAFADLTSVPGKPARALLEGLGIQAYAGFPVFDRDGSAVGTVCALHDVPHEWSQADLDTLADLAEACSAEIRLRQERRRAQQLQELALEAGRRTQLLLELTDRFARATTLADLVAALQHTAGGIGVATSVLGLLDATGSAVQLLNGVDGYTLPGRLRITDPLPGPHALRTRTPVYCADGPALLREWPEMARWADPDTGAMAFLPLIADGTVRGLVVLAWERPQDIDPGTRETCAALAACVATGLDRVHVLEDRHRVAATLQAAMLTELPTTTDLELAATYSTATRTDRVGGDWYDAVVRGDHTVLMIGDVTGHDMQAAARMGQLRSMLRTLAWSEDVFPATLLRRLDHANHGLALEASATVLVARFDRRGDRRTLSWSSAGHPPPLVLRGSDGTVVELAGRSDLLLGIDHRTSRSDHRVGLEPGDTLVLHTDGLVESRTTTYARRAAELRAALTELADLPTARLPRVLVERMVPGSQRDDVAVLAARVR
ncbi:GAF domain-containing SpoIIE family protein phosphatase [Isoptericola croceus]|uniref:GAF domain-containing SpoIIE family protein phosphatase n=1 Tax=Isoptericola croceus TaxID=3031406 RepID=UPI0023F9E9DB|nr:SpoIIE family protein phosphatase [Isoptericola croceus]